MRLLKALWKLRPPGGPEPPAARLVRRWREKRLLARLEREWPGGFARHRERAPVGHDRERFIEGRADRRHIDLQCTRLAYQ